MKSADLFFLPSEWEGVAVSIYEAMACGVAVVGADVGGQRELVTPECGVLIAKGNAQHEVDAYARVLAELLANPSELKKMGAAGRARVSAGFQLDEMGQNMGGELNALSDCTTPSRARFSA